MLRMREAAESWLEAQARGAAPRRDYPAASVSERQAMPSDSFASTAVVPIPSLPPSEEQKAAAVEEEFDAVGEAAALAMFQNDA